MSLKPASLNTARTYLNNKNSNKYKQAIPPPPRKHARVPRKKRENSISRSKPVLNPNLNLAPYLTPKLILTLASACVSKLLWHGSPLSLFPRLPCMYLLLFQAVSPVYAHSGQNALVPKPPSKHLSPPKTNHKPSVFCSQPEPPRSLAR